ncbi:MAG: 50S ribosomal protein L11 methyltransferase [Acidaminococcus sp.]|jgi:ribosomal protein L11 methyltransferase|nr:50S ribosomal protein L11 methyltransferase [Acidaminococcus sp.]MCI2115991.1 50S ribosomal protein L11 methyltransferase [Acidaminococcus sp.]
MDKWLQVSVKVTHEAVEAVAELLRDTGARNGVEIEDPLLLNQLRESATWELCDIPAQTNTEVVTVTAYYPKNDVLTKRLDTIEAGLKTIEQRIGKFRFGPTLFREVSEEDWANQWKQYFHTTKIGKSIVIKPSWEKYEPKEGEKIIALDPGMAFGTGTHATTSMCIERLQELVTPDSDVFDVGTGSGILAMTAALMGARSVHAVDIDEKAVEVAKENITQNHLSDAIDVRQGNLLDGTEGQADLIVANIIADIIIAVLPEVIQKLRPDGTFLASGVIEERFEDVRKAAAEKGLVVTDVRRRAGWTAITMRKEQ